MYDTMIRGLIWQSVKLLDGNKLAFLRKAIRVEWYVECSLCKVGAVGKSCDQYVQQQ